MTPPDTAAPLPPSPPHRNQQLFSDYYLNALLPNQSAWNALLPDADAMRHDLRKIFARYTPGGNEAQVEADWVRPVLSALGHTFEVQAPLETPENVKRPDYVFYPNAAAVAAHRDVKKLNNTVLRAASAYAVGDAKAWDRPLDITEKKTGKNNAVFDNKNPTYQIAFYIQHTGLDWGILTNGRLWRLYHKDTAHKLSRFYEVNLPELLAMDDPAPFLYFYTFFRRAAFDETDALANTTTLSASEESAQKIGGSLKNQVYDALRHIGQGFLDYPANKLSLNTPETRRALYDNALILLYRLLFVLYAEARELLPVRETGYRETYSLYALKRQVAKDRDTNRAFLASSALRWPTLRELFQIIDKGSPPLKVTTYNGGLFDAERHPFLEKYSVGDVRLNAAIECLTRVADPVTGNRVFVDYRDLSERHLGTIYEGLLEYQIRPLPAPAEGFTLELVNDRGERKATGSYYTPDYIVKYIVDTTVGAALNEAIAGKTTDAEIVAAVLGVNVLDPAMGSGHFLVEATEYIARFLVDLGVASETGEPDIAYWKRRVVHSCIYGVDLNPLAVDLAKLSLWLSTLAADRPLSFLDHHLRTGNALVGAAIADLSVNILRDKKKTTPKKSDPPTPEAAKGQLSLLSDNAFQQNIGLAVGNMWLIEDSEAESVAAVKAQEALYATIKDEYTRRYKRLADVVTAAYFGLSVPKWLWTTVARYVTEGIKENTLPQVMQIAGDADAMAHEQRFFHWSLEFPELFFDRQGRPLDTEGGFDVVLGNPPYIRQEALAPFKPYFQTEYADVYSSAADLSVYFVGQALRQLRQGGKLSYITSGTFQKLNYGLPLRRMLSTLNLQEVVLFGDKQVFAEAITYPVVLVVRKESSAGDTVRVRFDGDLSDDATIFDIPKPKGDLQWQFTKQTVSRGIANCTLRDLLTDSIRRGITTGLNGAFELSRESYAQLASYGANGQFLKPYLRGENLSVWHQKESSKPYLIAIPNGWTKAHIGQAVDETTALQVMSGDFPTLMEHLMPFSEQLKSRDDKGDYWWELRACAYYALFEKPRIHSTKISHYPTFSYLAEPSYVGNTSYVLSPVSQDKGLFALAILNSRFSEYYSRQHFAAKANGYYEVQPAELEKMPIPVTTPADEAALAERATTAARERYVLHTKTARRIESDLLPPGKPLNNRLREWWNLPDLQSLRAELAKIAKTDIPVKDRDDWDDLLTGRKAKHNALTETLIAIETEINAHVYRLFALTDGEQKEIEAATRYAYGAV